MNKMRVFVWSGLSSTVGIKNSVHKVRFWIQLLKNYRIN